MRSIEAEGASIDEAISRALTALGVDREQVDLEILENARRGVLGIGRQAARVRATMRRPMSWLETAPTPDAPAAEPGVGTGERIPRDGSDAPRPGGDRGARRDRERSVAAPPTLSAAECRELLAGILSRMGLNVSVSQADEPGTVLIVSGADASEVVGRHGEVLDALEHVLARMIERRAPDAPRATIDADGYRDRRRSSLGTLAKRAAEKVRLCGKAVTLAAMSPVDRRSIHVALQAEAGVSARSVGDGFYRKLVIIPDRGRGGGKARR